MVNVIRIQCVLVTTVLILSILIIAYLESLAHWTLIKYLCLDVSEFKWLRWQVHHWVLSMSHSWLQCAREYRLVPCRKLFVPYSRWSVCLQQCYLNPWLYQVSHSVSCKSRPQSMSQYSWIKKKWLHYFTQAKLLLVFLDLRNHLSIYVQVGLVKSFVNSAFLA